MAGLIGVAALIAVALWLLGGRRSRSAPAAEDDVVTAIDRERLADAERDLADDPEARPLSGGVDDEEDDWGPGSGSGR